MNKWLFNQNGFTRASFSATVAWVSKFVDENVFLFYIVKTPRHGAFSHSLPYTSNVSIVKHSACSNYLIMFQVKNCAVLLYTTLKADFNR